MVKWPNQQVTCRTNEHGNDEHIQTTNVVTDVSILQ